MDNDNQENLNFTEPNEIMDEQQEPNDKNQVIARDPHPGYAQNNQEQNFEKQAAADASN